MINKAGKPQPHLASLPRPSTVGAPTVSKSATVATRRSNNYTSAILRGQHPSAITSASLVWDMVMVSNQRLKKLSHGERLYNVVESSRVSTTAPFSITTELTDPRASLAHEHSQTLALRRASSIATNTVAPTRLAHNRPPYTTGSLPARLSTPSTTLRRTKTATSRYVHKVAKVEHRVANLAKALGADYTLAEAQAIDLSPKTFNGYVPRKEGHRWCDERFETYFNQDASTKLIYGCDVGLSTIKAGGGKSGKSSESAPPASSASPPSASWLAVDRQGAALTRPVPSQSLGDKVTFRLINFKDQLAYAPIRFGQPVWMVITSGCGDDNWRSGSFLGGRPVAEVSLPITEQFVNRGSETRKNNPVQEMVREELSKREKTVSRVKEERVNPNQRVKANNEKVSKSRVTSCLERASATVLFASEPIAQTTGPERAVRSLAARLIAANILLLTSRFAETLAAC